MDPNNPYPNQGYPQQPGYPQQQPQMYYPQAPYPQQPVRQYTVSFGQAISRGFANYATFGGRASRSEYWWWVLFQFLLMIIPLILMIVGIVSSIGSTSYYDPYDPYGYTPSNPYSGLMSGIGMVGLVLYCIICLGLFIPSLALTWRRLHDIGHSGAWYLLCLVPFVNYIWCIVMLVWVCMPSKPFANQYGPVPNQLP